MRNEIIIKEAVKSNKNNIKLSIINIRIKDGEEYLISIIKLTINVMNIIEREKKLINNAKLPMIEIIIK